MVKANAEWTVLEHGGLVQAEGNLWFVDGALPNMPLRRRMTIARRTSGELVVHNAIALGPAAIREVEALGRIAYIIVPSGWHRLDAPAFRRRYPEAKLLCPPGARDRVLQVVTVDGGYDLFPPDDDIRFELLEGLAGAEGVMRVRSGEHLTLVFNDALFNVPHQKGLGGFFFRALGSTGGPRVTRIMKTFAVKDKKALRAHLERLAEEGPHRIVPGHGDIIERDAGAVLRQVAAAL